VPRQPRRGSARRGSIRVTGCGGRECGGALGSTIGFVRDGALVAVPLSLLLQLLLVPWLGFFVAGPVGMWETRPHRVFHISIGRGPFLSFWSFFFLCRKAPISSGFPLKRDRRRVSSREVGYHRSGGGVALRVSDRSSIARSEMPPPPFVRHPWRLPGWCSATEEAQVALPVDMLRDDIQPPNNHKPNSN